MTAKLKMRKTRAIPQALAPLLDLLALVPRGFEPTGKIVNALMKVVSGPELEPEFTKVFKDRVRELPKRIQRHIGALHDDDSGYLSQMALRRYNELADSREFLLQIAGISFAVIGEIQGRSEPLNERNARKAIASLDKDSNVYIPRIAFYQLPIDARGRLDWFLNPLLADLHGEELLRIRSCQVCGRIFWAGRMDKTACSGKCGQVSRKRKQRGKESLTVERRQQYNEARKKRRMRESTRQSQPEHN